MIIEKTFKGNDGVNRKWLLDTDENCLIYFGLAKDMQTNERRFTINTINDKTAQELIDEVSRE